MYCVGRLPGWKHISRPDRRGMAHAKSSSVRKCFAEYMRACCCSPMSECILLIGFFYPCDENIPAGEGHSALQGGLREMMNTVFPACNTGEFIRLECFPARLVPYYIDESSAFSRLNYGIPKFLKIKGLYLKVTVISVF